ncbi:MAG: hypothetical protein KBT10_08645 [Bacteroidales bacterium]|nr:hypothetical protein [Candidatus Sodaliphilus aphodohippi]
MKRLYRFIPLAMIVAVILLEACSTKKNTAGSRFWQSMNTRYNVYYNGKTNYDEQIKELENNYQDDYSQRLFVHPAEAKANPKAPQPGGSFDRTIEKMQKAISLHSIKKKPKRKAGKGNDPKTKEWMSRDEYNPFLHNAWYLLAKAEYMKGDFLNAAATFRYISRHFTWKPDLVQESQVWEALCYTALGWGNEADNVLAHIHIDKIEDKGTRSLANLAFADYYIKEHLSDRAIPYLAEAVKGFGGAQKVRLNFLLGQLYEENGQKDLAYNAFKRAGSSSGSSYRTKFNARIKQSAVYNGTNMLGEVKALRNMTHYDRNKEYLDQIYYAIGNLYLSRQDTVHAVENYIKAAEKSTRNGIDKAISQLTLGGIYFNQSKYDLAQPCYSEAIPQINEDYPNYKMLKHRSDVLDELAVYSQNVTLQDSLLKLSRMSLDEQKAVIKKIIDALKKKEKEEAEAAQREEYMAQQSAKGDPNASNPNAPQTFQMNNDKSWYFYNNTTKAAGKTQFQKMWGNRKLEDNWRRRNKNTFSLEEDTGNAANDTTANMAANDPTGNDTTKVDKEALKRAEDPHYEEYYLKQIPKTDEERQASNDIIEEGLFNMGIILKDKLEDANAAEVQFNELMRRYPESTHRLDIYYNMYLMFMRSGQTAKAERCRDVILNEFADTKYGIAMQDPNYLDNLKNMEADQESMYEQAYANYLANNNEAVHQAYAEMMRRYPLSKIMPKFMFIDALSYVTQKHYDQFKTTIKEMLQRYPETDITPTASAIVKQLNQGRKLEGGGSNARGMFWSTRLSNDTTAADIERKFTPFNDDLDKPQVYVLLYPSDSVNANKLLYEVARHNFNSFVVKDYDMEQMNFSRLGLLIIKGFENYDEVKHYHTVFEQDNTMDIPESVHEVIISESNFQLLLNEGRSFEDYFQYLEEKNEKDVEGKIPPATAKERAAAAAADKKAKAAAEKKAKAEEAKKKKEEEKQAREEQKRLQKQQQEQEKKRQEAEKKRLAEEKKRQEAQMKAENQAGGTLGSTIDNAGSPDNAPSVIESEKDINDEVERAQTAVEPANNSKLQELRAKRLGKKDDSGQEKDKPAVTNSVRKTKDQDNSKETEKAAKEQEKAAKEQAKKYKEEQKRLDKLAEEKIRQQDKLDAQNDKEYKKRQKELEKAEKKRLKDEEKRQKEEQKMLEKLQKQKEDSIRRAELEADLAIEKAREAKKDSMENLQKRKQDEIKQQAQAKIDTKKQREKERKERLKAKEQERKQKAAERKQKEKEREAKRKEQEKLRKQQAKEREQAQKQKQKEREQERKQREQERKQAAKQREAERKAKK